MAFKFPFTNYHELNLTWILDQLKSLFEKSEENVTTIETYENRLTAVETELPSVSETASEASRAATSAGALAQTAKATADTAQNNAIQAQGLAGTARQEAQAAQTAANEATQAAQQAQATAQNFDGRITQAENDASQALEASRSFENRVQSAITTANNASQTATNAQGIAMRADQNAGSALDKIGDLSQLTTNAKQNLVVAINEAAQSGGVTSVNGKTGAVVLNASDIGYNDTTVKTALDGKQNAPTAAGTAGQVLGLNNSLQPVWVDQTGGSGDNSNCAPLIINTASGAIASFPDGADNRQIRKIVGTIEPVQAAGTPSPETPLPISGWTEANIYNEETYNASATPKLTINWQSEAGTIYGGTVTLNEDGSVDLVRTWRGARLDALSWSYNSKWSCFESSNISRPNNTAKRITMMCSMYKTIPNSPYPEGDLVINFNSSSGSSISYFRVKDSSCGTDVSAFVAKITENNAFACWEDKTQMWVTYHFDNIGQLFTFLGTNNVWINTGSITECLYPADTKLYIDNKIAELQAMALENNG